MLVILLEHEVKGRLQQLQYAAKELTRERWSGCADQSTNQRTTLSHWPIVDLISVKSNILLNFDTVRQRLVISVLKPFQKTSDNELKQFEICFSKVEINVSCASFTIKLTKEIESAVFILSIPCIICVTSGPLQVTYIYIYIYMSIWSPIRNKRGLRLCVTNSYLRPESNK